MIEVNEPSSSTLEVAWDVLEQFGESLQQCNHPRFQVRLVLDSVRDSLDADAVLWHPGSSGESFARADGSFEVSSLWTRQFVERVARGDRLVRHFLDPGAKPIKPWPTSVAMARMNESTNSWLIALSFHPRRLFHPIDLKVLLLTRRMLLNHCRHKQGYEKLRDSMFGLVRCLTAAIDAKHAYALGHSERVARLAVRLGQQMGLPEATLGELYLSGLLHDVGNLGLSEQILQKPAPLTEDEFAQIKQHTLLGDQMIARMKPLHRLRAGIRHHHERWDGRGYPDGLAGQAIPSQARLLAVAEALDAVHSDRPHRPALPIDQIDELFTQGAGKQWDPDLIAIFLTCREDLYAICASRSEELLLSNDPPTRLMQIQNVDFVEEALLGR